MNQEILKSAGIDYAFCVKRFAGRANLSEKALLRFSKDATFSRIQAAYEEKDNQLLLASAHEFKGMCGNIGLTPLFEGSDAIVQMLRGGGFAPEELSAAYVRLEELYKTIYLAVIASMEDTL